MITFVSLRDGPFQYLPDGPNKIFWTFQIFQYLPDGLGGNIHIFEIFQYLNIFARWPEGGGSEAEKPEMLSPRHLVSSLSLFTIIIIVIIIIFILI